MKSKEYLPRSEAQLTFWCDGFKVQFPAHAAELGFSESDITTITGACTGINTSISDVNTAKIVFEEKVSQKNKTVELNTAMIREMVRRIKVSPTYTEALGKLLGIVGEGSTFDPTTAVPYVTLMKSATGWDFKFNLMNFFSAVAVFRRNPGEATFTQVDVDLKSPYSITSPIVSGVEYYFQFMKHDKLMGQPSDIIVVKL
ncbi:MAG: hypothetical protein WC703_08810 [Candidatus Neomarinimicrobiota bacterium]